MAKFLLFVAVIAAIIMLVRASNRRSKTPPAAPKTEAMAHCAYCGVHFPSSEALSQGGQDYCCEDHRRLGPRS